MSSRTNRDSRKTTQKHHKTVVTKGKKEISGDNQEFLVTCNYCHKDLTNEMRVICAVCPEHGL